MTNERPAVANISAFGRERPGPPSNLIPFNPSLREAQRRGNLDFQKSNILQLPEIFRPQLTVITPDHKPARIIEFSKSKPAEVTPSQKPETSIIDEVKKTESFHPRKRQKVYYDKMGRLVLRRRRASRCRTGGEHTKENCPTGSPARCRAVNRNIKQNENVAVNTNSKVRSIDSGRSIRRARAGRDQLMKKAA